MPAPTKTSRHKQNDRTPGQSELQHAFQHGLSLNRGIRHRPRASLRRRSERVAQKQRAFGRDQFADFHAFENLPIAVVAPADLDGPLSERRRSAVTHTVIVPSPSRTTPSDGTPGERTGATDAMTKFANMPERSSCCGSLISERTRTRRVFGSTRRADGRDLAVERAAGKRITVTCTCCPRRNAGLSASATSASIHIGVDIGNTYKVPAHCPAAQTAPGPRCAP